MAALEFEVVDAAAVLNAARARGYTVEGNSFFISGVDIRVVA
jgi:hypothetical protein